MRNVPFAIELSAKLIGLLSVSQFVVALDLAFHFLPAYPVIQYMRAAGPLAQAIWVASGFLAVVTVVALIRRPNVGFALALAYAAVYVPTAMVLWRHVSWGSWLAMAAAVIAGIGAWQARGGGWAARAALQVDAVETTD